jgi:signal transduction histidine kinase/CheY-like chemotaxis protein
MTKNAVKVLVVLMFLFVFSDKIQSQENVPVESNVLYINSYATTYTWADSLVSGVLNVFNQRKGVQLYIEFLDAKRFERSQFKNLFNLYKNKYRNIKFNVAIVSDNDALDFIMEYADSLIPGVPVVFCGINNPGDYNFENTNFYGILDGIDLKAEIDLIAQAMPDLKKLYFIADGITTTSLINMRYIRKLEPEYASRFKFVCLSGLSLDSMLQAVSKIEKGSAIGLINYHQDRKGNAFNTESVNLQVILKSTVPIFMESETLLGKGIAGGIFIKGSVHGRDAANLALKFIDFPNYTPPERIVRPENRYYFDYKILEQYQIANNNLPANAIIINKPHDALFKYLKFIFALTTFIGLLLVIVMILYLKIRQRKTAEEMVLQKLDEIKEKNVMLKETNQQVNEMNIELKEIHERLSATNEELKEAKEKSEESDRLKSAFLANMSHEIRTPLNAIIGFSSLLNDASLSLADRDEYFQIINSNGYQLLHIIENILDLSKIEAGQLESSIESFSVHQLTVELVDFFNTSVDRNQVKIIIPTIETNSELVLNTDRGRFKQILSNLLSNSVKFTKKGKIEIGCNLESPDNITFFVKDTGIGFEKKDLPNIFNRFWKAEDHVDKFHAGAGLGLAICKRLCDTLGCKIWAESLPGQGSDFYFTLPTRMVKWNPVSDEIKTATDFLNENRNFYSIAIVEDDESNLFLLTRILKKLNVNIISFRNGAEIVDFFRNNTSKPIDLILMDIKMPEMDGFMATKLIREIHPGMPIIAQTAYVFAADVEKINSSGFTDYISKPIRPVLLIEKVKKILYPEKK